MGFLRMPPVACAGRAEQADGCRCVLANGRDASRDAKFVEAHLWGRFNEATIFRPIRSATDSIAWRHRSEAGA